MNARSVTGSEKSVFNPWATAILIYGLFLAYVYVLG